MLAHNGACQRKGKGRFYTSRILVSQNDRDFMHTQSLSGFKECRLQYSGGGIICVCLTIFHTLTHPRLRHQQAQGQGQGRGKDKRETPWIGVRQNEEPVGMAAIDPGARTFATVYDGDSIFTVQHDRVRMKKMQTRLDRLRSLRTKKEITSRSYLRGRRRIKRKWDHLMADMHWKFASVLIQYKAIGLPSFRTQDMVQGNLNRVSNESFSVFSMVDFVIVFATKLEVVHTFYLLMSHSQL